MDQKTKRTAGIPEKIRILCLSMILALAGLTGCGRQELEFYTQEELAEASGTQVSDTGEEKSPEENTEASGTQKETAAQTESQGTAPANTESGKEAAAQAETADSRAAAEGTAAEDGTPAKIYVDVCGAVLNPGVYELEADSRVFQAIELAGGYLPEAAQSYLNRAGFLADGQQIYVPTQAEVDENPEKFGGGIASLASGEISKAASDGTTGAVSDGTTGSESGGAAESANGSGKVNLNTADISGLTTLTGIGESKAQAIIAYREANGGFQNIEELMKVDGIKEGTYAKIKDQITVG